MRLNIDEPGNGDNQRFRANEGRVVYLPDGSHVVIPSPELDKEHGSTNRTVSKPVEITSGRFGETRVRLIEDPMDRARTLLAVWRAGRVDFVEKFEHGKEVFAPPKRDDPLIKSMALPCGVRPYETPASLAREVGKQLNEVVPISERDELVLGSFSLLTWVSDALPLSPTVVLLGPRDFTIPLLQALGLFCRYALVVGDITPAGLITTCSRIRPTLLVADYELRRDTLRLLEMGSRPGISALQKGGAFSPFCPRVIASPETSLDRDLLSGGVVMPLALWGWPKLRRLSDPQFLEHADHLRQCLLQFELDQSGPIEPLVGDPLWGMMPREWEALSCWVAPFAKEKDFLNKLQLAIRGISVPATGGIPVERRATISALEFLAHGHVQSVSVGEIAGRANKVLEQMGEELRLKDRKVGAILKKLGFPNRERGGDDGPYQFEFTAPVVRQIHMLVRFYGVWNPELYSGQEPRETCRWCREFKLVSEGQIRLYEREWKPAIERRKRKEEEKRKKMFERLRNNLRGPSPMDRAKEGMKRLRNDERGRR